MPTLIKKDTESTVLDDSLILQVVLSLGEKSKLVSASFKLMNYISCLTFSFNCFFLVIISMISIGVLLSRL